MIFFGVIIFCIAIVHSPLVHAKRTEADDRLLYALDLDPKDVADFEVVTIILPKQSKESSKINGTSMKILSSCKNFELNLHPRDSMLVSNKTSVYLVNQNANKSGGVEYVLQERAMNTVGQLLEDRLQKASVILGTNDQDELTIMAAIGGTSSTPGMIIRSISEAVMEEHSRKRRSMDENLIHEDDDDDDDDDDFDDYEDYEDEDEDDAANFISTSAVVVNLNTFGSHKLGEQIERGKRAIHENAEIYRTHNRTASAESRSPAALYPKLLVAADFSYYRNHSPADLTRALEYFSVFFNTIDLQFRHLEDPMIRLHIAAITIATSPSATPYIERNMLANNKEFHHTGAINDMPAYFYNVNDQIPVEYDIAFALTRLPMTGNTKGVSRHGGVCSVSNGQMNGVVLVRDRGVFNEIEAAVHELGHSFGLPDDLEEEQPDDCLGPLCLKSSADISAPLSLEPRDLTFSDDSFDVLDELIENGTLSCMYEKPVKDSITLPESSPPKVASLTEQCQAHGKIGPCPEYEDNMCTQLRCIESNIILNDDTITLCTRLHHPAAPGTPCKVKGDPHPGYCHHNRCVSV